ncbi:MAG TPA: class D sortase [Thermoanaerobaculia bacterium]
MFAKRLGTALIAAGVVLLGVWAAARLHTILGSRQDRARFEEQRAAARMPAPPAASATLPSPVPTADAALLPRLAERPVDVSLWSDKRVKEWKESLEADRRAPLALLRMPRLKIDVPVLEGTDDLTLNRGAGWIEGTARPGEPGNVALSAHRDGFFRALKDVAVGDEIVLETPHATTRYAVAWTKIVDPDDVWVLNETDGPAVTLVTCYPFYFVGSAPRRLIVRATPLSAAPAPTSGPPP